MDRLLHPFYPIVPDTDWLARIVPLGVKTVQLRIKNQTNKSVRQQISAGLEICARHDCQLIVNDHWRAALDLGAGFVHLGQEDLIGADLKALKAADCRIGISTHSHAELDTALAASPDYVALGPIWETKLKKMPWSPQGLNRIRDWKSRLSCPLVAIGGITLARAPGVYAAGADAIAVITDFVTSPDPDARARDWLSL